MGNEEVIQILEIMANKSIHWPKEHEALNVAIAVLKDKENKIKIVQNTYVL